MADLTRRSFLGSAGALGVAAGQATAANDRINVGMIAVGSRSQELLEAIKKVPGTEIVGISDAYRGRLERAQERTGGRAKIYLNHEELLADPNIDAVTVGSPDHWHKDHVIAALEAGKDVYCEKPLTKTVDEGAAIAAAVKKSGKLLQVGSQGISSNVQAKAREWIQAGKLGRVTMIRASYNRNTASGAWVYPIPPDASPHTVDWKMFLGSAPEHLFDLERFFRWRCYQDYSGGIATDLFVHLTTTIHYVMNAAMPSHVVGRGSLYQRKESRDVPDTLNAILEYPEGFTVNLSSTFNNQYDPAGSFEFLGTEGTLLLGWSKLTFIPERNFESNGWITQAWPSDLERAYDASPEVKRESEARSKARGTERKIEEYKEVGASATVKHFVKFFESVRSRKPTVEGVEAAHRAAACAHMVNESARSDKLLKWDFENDRQKV